MDYIGNKCPVCDKYFHAGDDIVVCPECGTPHHRECYESCGKCVYSDKHDSGFVYKSDEQHSDADTTLCKKCGFENPKDAFFCNKCGASLSDEPFTQGNTNSSNTQNSRQYGSAPFQNGLLDPLGGIDPKADMGEQVTAGEIAKYVKQNTPYYSIIFNNIKNFSRSRFNFSAAVFSGGFLLYRKIYKLGALFASLQAALLVMISYINYYVQTSTAFSTVISNYEKIATSGADYSTMTSKLMEFLSGLSSTQLLIMCLPQILSFLNIIMMIVIGACANRMYFSHCKKQIVRIKAQSESVSDADVKLQTKGGVNTALGFSLLITYLVICYLPQILSGIM